MEVKLPDGFEDMTIGDIKKITAGRTVIAGSEVGDDKRVVVHVFARTQYIKFVAATEKMMRRCHRQASRDQQNIHDYFEPLELQELERERVRDATQADGLPGGVSLVMMCNNDRETITQYEWDEFIKDPDNEGKRVVTIFLAPGKQGHCYDVEYLLADMRRDRAFKWFGTKDFGRPDPSARYYRLMGLSIYVDANSLDRLELSGGRLFRTQLLGKEVLGTFAGIINEGVPQDVFTLVPLSPQEYGDFVRPPKRAAREPDESSEELPTGKRRIVPEWLGPATEELGDMASRVGPEQLRPVTGEAALMARLRRGAPEELGDEELEVMARPRRGGPEELGAMTRSRRGVPEELGS